MSLAVTQGIDKDQNVLFFQNIPKLEVMFLHQCSQLSSHSKQGYLN